MGYFRFRRRAGLLGGLVHLNLSKTGISASVGVPGATLNVPMLSTRKRNSAVTVGLPGTGLSYRQELKSSSQSQPVEPRPTEISRTIHDATPERTAAAIRAVEQAAAIVGCKPQIGAPHDVDVSNQTCVRIRCRHLRHGTEYQVVDNHTNEVESRHETLEEAQQWIAKHVHVKQIDVVLGVGSPQQKPALAEEASPAPEAPRSGSALASFLVFGGVVGFVAFWMFMLIHF